jgi:hypothetical protein
MNQLMTFTVEQLSNIPHTLSEPRFATYLQHSNNDPNHALELYQWNLEISSAFMTPIHLYEIVIRNAVIEPLEIVYTSNWPWDRSFILSLPDPSRSYSPRKNLVNVSNDSRNTTMGKVVAELKFAFWEKMFTARHDVRLWNPHFRTVFSNAPSSHNIHYLREKIYHDIFAIRKLRNRIAHHEPIFTRNLHEDYDRILELISWRDPVASDWLDNIQKVSELLLNRP